MILTRIYSVLLENVLASNYELINLTKFLNSRLIKSRPDAKLIGPEYRKNMKEISLGPINLKDILYWSNLWKMRLEQCLPL